MAWPRSIRLRLTLFYAALLAVLLLSLGAAGLLFVRRAFTEHTDRFLAETAESFAGELAAEQIEHPTFAEALKAALDEFHPSDIRIIVLGRDTVYPLLGSAAAEGGRISDAELVPLVRAALVERQGDTGAFTLPLGEAGYRVSLHAPVAHDPPIVIAAVQSRFNEHEAIEALLIRLLIAVPLLLMLAAATGYFFAWRSLQPVAAMGRQAAQITAERLDSRLPVRAPHDELGQLAATINELLDRLEHAFGQQRRFMADASHELRTPLTVIRNEAEISLQRERTGEEYRDALVVVHGEAVRLSRIVNDLFLLARADAGEQPIRPGALYLNDLIAEVVRSLQSLAETQAATVFYEPGVDAPYHGDEDLLRRLLVNLVENAIRYSGVGGRVHVTLAREATSYRILVRDNGPGIPGSAQPYVFDRFYRIDEPRSPSSLNGSGGAGLGLAIARWVAAAHGGTLVLLRADRGATEFQLLLPIH